MAEIKIAVIKHLMLNTAVVAAFGNRITVDKVPDDQSYPYAYLTNISDPQQYHHGGESGRLPIVQIDVFGSSAEEADTSSELIRVSLSGYRGQMGDIYAGRVFAKRVGGAWAEEERNFRRIIEVEIGTND